MQPERRVPYGRRRAVLTPTRRAVFLQPCDVRGERKPAPSLAHPHVGVAAAALGAVRLGVARARMDDRGVVNNADHYVLGLDVLDRNRLRGLLQEARAIDQRAIWIAAVELVAEDFVEALHV